MFNVMTPLLKDGYKADHRRQYPKDTVLVYNNMTPRGTRRIVFPGGVVSAGQQYLVREWFINHFQESFFERPLDEVIRRYKRRMDNYLGKDAISTDHIAALHKLGYLPLVVKAVPEGTLVPLRVPVMTIHNTVGEFFWLPNMLETLVSNALWMAMTSATTALSYRQNFEAFAAKTGADPSFIQFQGHDFSMRGMSGIEAAILSGFGHLLSFVGTDTIPAIDFVEQYYDADSDRELVGCSVPATEHSVMCMGLEDGEFETFESLITQVYPNGIVSIVSDTWDFWRVITDYLPRLRSAIMARNGKLVIRPDSGDPANIICGDPSADHGTPERLGAIRLMWEIFGGTINKAGFKELDSHIGLIYGDSITLERQQDILQRLHNLGFASSNVVLGIGSYTYQYVTRDTDGWAIKATYGERRAADGSIIPQNISKKPKTDSGVKNSASGLLSVRRTEEGVIYLEENCTWQNEAEGLLIPIFKNGALLNQTTLSEIRQRISVHFKDLC